MVTKWLTRCMICLLIVQVVAVLCFNVNVAKDTYNAKNGTKLSVECVANGTDAKTIPEAKFLKKDNTEWMNSTDGRLHITKKIDLTKYVEYLIITWEPIVTTDMDTGNEQESKCVAGSVEDKFKVIVQVDSSTLKTTPKARKISTITQKPKEPLSTKQTMEPNSNSTDSINKGKTSPVIYSDLHLIYGLVIGFILIAIVVTVLVLLFKKKRKECNKSQSDSSPLHQDSTIENQPIEQ